MIFIGYGFIGSSTPNGETIFYEECMYAYQPVFKECFGKDISEFSGNVTQKTIEEFERGLQKFKLNRCNSKDHKQIPGYLSNITYDKLCDRLLELLTLMKEKEVCYLIIE